MSLNRYRLKHLKNQQHKGAIRAGKLLEKPDRLITVILTGNNLVNIAASAIATVIAIRLYGDAGIIIATIALTLIVLIFAEITPKTIAALQPEKVAFPASAILLPLLRLLRPVVSAVNSITNQLLKLLGFDPETQGDEEVSTAELRTIVTEAGSLIPPRHRGMLVNILDLEEVSVDDIMVPRNEVHGIDLDDSDDEIMNCLQNSAHTLLPVWKKDLSNILGVLHLRNLSRVINHRGLDRTGLEGEMVRPYFIPEGTPLHTQLMEFQRKKVRLAFVVDEYGDVMGLVALEDILEEIVGEFTSNLESSDHHIFRQRDGSVIIDGGASIRDINKQLDWDLSTDGPKTISGLLLEYLESFPDANVSLSLENYKFEILELQGNVIKSTKGQKFESTG